MTASPLRLLLGVTVAVLVGIPVGGALLDPAHGGAYLLAVLPVAAVAVFFAVLLHGEER